MRARVRTVPQLEEESVACSHLKRLYAQPEIGLVHRDNLIPGEWLVTIAATHSSLNADSPFMSPNRVSQRKRRVRSDIV